jgi:hypothetical protein
VPTWIGSGFIWTGGVESRCLEQALASGSDLTVESVLSLYVVHVRRWDKVVTVASWSDLGAGVRRDGIGRMGTAAPKIE